jgi:hypothetical protein
VPTRQPRTEGNPPPRSWAEYRRSKRDTAARLVGQAADTVALIPPAVDPEADRDARILRTLARRVRRPAA